MRRGILILMAAGLWGCGPATGTSPLFGIVTVDSDSMGCLAIRDHAPAPGTPVLVVVRDGTETQTVIAGSVHRELTSPCDPFGVLEDSTRAYSVYIPNDRESSFGPSIAVIGPGLVASDEGGTVTIRAPGKGSPLTFRDCTSYEGMHFTVWQGKKRVWHQYYYLGYDVEPTCTDEDVGP